MANVLVTTTTFTCLAAFVVAVRLWTRLRLIKAPGWDDMLISNALIADFAFYAFVLVERHYGLGLAKSELSDNEKRGVLRFLWLSLPFYNLALILAKLSALVLFVRIFHSRPFLLATYIFMGVLILCGLFIVLSGFIFCVPVHAFWNLSYAVRHEHCLPKGTIWYLNAAIQILTDIGILLLPMPLLAKMNLPRRQKIGIFLVFGVGIFVIATSSTRLFELSEMVETRDYTKANSRMAVWSSLEANVSIICACLPPLHPLLSRIFSYCFLPQPLHSSQASRYRMTGTVSKNTTHLTSSSRKPSIYEPSSTGGIFYNEIFQSGLGSYSASITNAGSNEGGGGAFTSHGHGHGHSRGHSHCHGHCHHHHGDDAREEEDPINGIRVVRELRIGSDTASADTEHARISHDCENRVASAGAGASGFALRSPTIEWDLDEFEFPDYRQRMNAPI